jgi:hypothetical protein
MWKVVVDTSNDRKRRRCSIRTHTAQRSLLNHRLADNTANGMHGGFSQHSPTRPTRIKDSIALILKAQAVNKEMHHFRIYLPNFSPLAMLAFNSGMTCRSRHEGGTQFQWNNEALTLDIEAYSKTTVKRQ